MATHSSVLAWRIPGMGEPGGLLSMGSHIVEHDWSDLAAAAADSILKSRDITLTTKVHLVKAIVFPVVLKGCESWSVKKARCQRTDAFELWCWRRLLRVPSTARRSNQSIRKEISPEYSLEGLMVKLKLPYLGHLMQELTHWKRPWCWERLRAGGEGDERGWDGWMASLSQWTWVWAGSRHWWWTGKPGLLQSMRSQRDGHDWMTGLNWTEWLWRRRGMKGFLMQWNYSVWHCNGGCHYTFVKTHRVYNFKSGP